MSEQPKEIIREVIRYSSYTEAQKKATKKYMENNREKVNERRKLYYQQRKERDPVFMEYKRTKAKEYYLKKKDTKPEIKTEELIEVKEPEVKEPEVKELVKKTRKAKLSKILVD